MGKKTHREAFELFAERVMERFETVEEIRLFGSVARNEHGPYSDIDVLIIVEDMSEREAIEQTAFTTTAETGIPIAPIIVKRDTYPRIRKTAEEEGVKYHARH